MSLVLQAFVCKSKHLTNCNFDIMMPLHKVTRSVTLRPEGDMNVTSFTTFHGSRTVVVEILVALEEKSEDQQSQQETSSQHGG